MLKPRNLVLLLCMLLIALPVMAQDSTPDATMMEEGEYTVNLRDTEEYGQIMVGPTGMTLYTFSPDPVDGSVCAGQCATAWPPLTVDDAGALTADEGIPGVWSTFAREDGSLQVAYNGQALYYWFKDEKPGDTSGNRVGHNWWVVPPATVSIEHHKDLGPILMGSNGMTLYTFKNDAPDTSNCAGDCATNWPPLTVASADDLVSGVNLPGAWGTITREDGSLQVTYNSWPLYYFKNDAAIGDATGEGAGDKWYTVAPETVSVATTDALGDVVVSFDGLTVYTFKNDTAGSPSTCTGDCAKAWPAVPVSDKGNLVAGAGVTGTLGRVATADGKGMQLTYNGWPLYYFKDDVEPGMTTGDGKGGVWSAVKP